MLAWLIIGIILLVSTSGIAIVYATSTNGVAPTAPLSPPSQNHLKGTSVPTGKSPVACSVDSSHFCSLFHLPPGTPCTFDSSYVNDQCEMPCEAVVKLFRQFGTYNYPSVQFGHLSMGLTAAPPGTAPNDSECRLANAMNQYAILSQHNSMGDTSEDGIRNFYLSIGSCISKAYAC